MSYQPQPGTIPYRAIEWMKSMAKCGNHGPFPTAELCEALETEAWGFAPYMRPARESGLVHSQRIPGRGMHVAWSLGDGKPDPCLYEIHQPTKRTLMRYARAPLPEWRAPTFRAVETPAGWVVTGVQIVDGAAVFTREQFNALRGGA